MGLLNVFRDPTVFADRDDLILAEGYARCVGLDPSTKCGIAIADFKKGEPPMDVKMWLGQLDLSLGTYDTGPLRLLRLQNFLAVCKPSLIAFEDVKYTPNEEDRRGKNISAIITRAATSVEFQGTLKAAITTWAEYHKVPAQPYGITMIKRHATGKGNVGKPAMIRACNDRFGTDFDPDTYQSTGADNMADAAFACELGLLEYAEGFH